MIMPQYTEESLDKLLRRKLIRIVLSLEEHNRTLQKGISEVSNKVVEEMHKFNENFSKFHLKLSVTKCINNELTTQIATLERQHWANAQYSKKECVKVVDIPQQVDNKHKEAKAAVNVPKGWLHHCS